MIDFINKNGVLFIAVFSIIVVLIMGINEIVKILKSAKTVKELLQVK